MKRGKKICNTLKEVRMQVARANDIPYEPTECRHEGDCLGTCPKCESEVRWLEQQLQLRRSLGKAVSLIGVSVGLAAITSCKPIVSNKDDDHLLGEVMPVEEMPDYMEINKLKPEQEEELTNDQPVAEPNSAIIIEPAGKVEKTDSLVVLSDTLKNSMIFGDVAETQPSFPGGNSALRQFIQDNLQYPKDAEDICVQGRVVVSFVVERDGSITDPKVVRSLHPLFDKEALRVVGLMPKWNPGRIISGETVRIKYNLPIGFKLE